MVLHEIYGLNEHIKGFCSKLSGEGFDVFAPDMLGLGRPFTYQEEEAAHRYFTEAAGFEKASRRITGLLHRMRKEYKNLFVAGFSAGATVAWLCGREGRCDAVFAFYGSRIRYYSEVDPACPALLFFPACEKSFDVDDLIRKLSGKNKVRAIKFDASHGFADPFCKNHCPESSERAYREMISAIACIRAF